MEALLETAPPTTAYNRTALLALYQSVLDGSGRASGYVQPPVSAPDAAFVAEVQGTQGGNAIMTAPAAAQVTILHVCGHHNHLSAHPTREQCRQLTEAAHICLPRHVSAGICPACLDTRNVPSDVAWHISSCSSPLANVNSKISADRAH